MKQNKKKINIAPPGVEMSTLGELAANALKEWDGYVLAWIFTPEPRLILIHQDELRELEKKHGQ